MANKNGKIINKEHEEMIALLAANADKLIGKLALLRTEGNKLHQQFASTFNMSEEELNKLFQAEPKLRESYDELTKRMGDLGEQIKKNVGNIDSLAKKYHVESGEMAKLLDKLRTYHDLQKEAQAVSEKKQKIEDNGGDFRERNRLKARLEDILKGIRQIEGNLNSSSVGARMLHDYGAEKSGRQKLHTTVNLQSKIKDNSEEIANFSKQTSENVYAANSALTAQQGRLNTLKALWRSIYGEGKKAFNKYLEINHAVTALGRESGMAASQVKGFENNVLSNYGAMAERLGMTFKDIFKFQESYIKNTGRAILLTNEQTESIAGLSTAVGEAAVSNAETNFDILGASSSTALDHLTLTLARAASQGLNVQQASEKFSQNIKMASKYTFREGVNGISKMTLLSQRLKFNMESVGAAMDKFNNIEGAISASANIQVLGGSYAANFTNPMQAMGEALLDAESFTKRIVDTVASTAVFNRESGQVEMSALDKAKMREASNQLGISYDELFNMASQQAKLGNIEAYLRGRNLDEEQRAYVANTAQYDAETKQWKVNIMNSNGDFEDVDIKDLSGEQIDEIRRTNDFEKSIQGDVHSIRSQLSDYLKTYVKETRSLQERITGGREHIAVNEANVVNNLGIPRAINWAFDTFGSAMTLGAVGVGSAVASAFGTEYLGKKFGGKFSKFVGRGGRNTPPATPTGNTFSGSESKLSKVLGKGSKLGRIFRIGKVAKGIGAVGTVLSVASAVSDYSAANSDLEEEKRQINADSSLSRSEKAKAKYEARKKANESKGDTLGGSIGSIAGMAIGTAVAGPVGAVVGGFLGNWIGGKIGSAIGSSTTKKERGMNDENSVNGNGEITQSVSQAEGTNYLSIIQEDVKGIRKTVDSQDFAMSRIVISSNTSNPNTVISESKNVVANSKSDVNSLYDGTSNIVTNNKNGYSSNVNNTTVVNPTPLYAERTPIRIDRIGVTSPSVTRPSVQDIKVDISGRIRIDAPNGQTANFDAKKLFESSEFVSMLKEKVTEGMLRGVSATGTEDRNSTKSIMGGAYSPWESYSQA